MAERRMFAKTIIDSDAFLEMPQSSQLLYFHLSMRADDDGFVNKPKAIMQMAGCKDDDVKILIAKKFIIPFESGIVVIKHWKIHNYIQSDRYTETKYKSERAMLELDENKAYTLSVYNMDTERIQDVSSLDTQVRLGKVRLGKSSINTTSTTDNPTLPESRASSRDVLKSKFAEFWKAYPKRVGKSAAQKAFFKCKPDDALFARMLEALDTQKHTDQWKKENGQFIPNPATWLNHGRWEDEVKTAAQTDIWGGVPEV